ncbi:chromatin structure-remodeling complex protein SYD-like [Dorcoceras hygrometricum]|uniref:Chromatin structure-remodeling complex protein SYD-like n=1 Tax=Dorcoceras hygrometricum TaxID=472368 RepID=A0A2Z7AUC7_9LAMI|nr:chromatin structure-remodeling complex protein SYD-like [Dorcoceras hygrometricum]
MARDAPTSVASSRANQQPPSADFRNLCAEQQLPAGHEMAAMRGKRADHRAEQRPINRATSCAWAAGQPAIVGQPSRVSIGMHRTANQPRCATSAHTIAHAHARGEGPVVSTNALEEQLYYVESPESPPPIPQRQESSSSSSDSQMKFDTTDIPLDDTTEAQTSLPAATVDLSPLLDDLKSSLSQYVDTAHSDILSRLRTVEQGLHNTLGFQNDYSRNLIQGARQEGKNNDDLQILRLNELKKSVLAQGVTTDTSSLEIRKAINAVDAKIILLDGQVAAIRSEHLEFQEKYQQIF